MLQTAQHNRWTFFCVARHARGKGKKKAAIWLFEYATRALRSRNASNVSTAAATATATAAAQLQKAKVAKAIDD